MKHLSRTGLAFNESISVVRRVSRSYKSVVDFANNLPCSLRVKSVTAYSNCSSLICCQQKLFHGTSSACQNFVLYPRISDKFVYVRTCNTEIILISIISR